MMSAGNNESLRPILSEEEHFSCKITIHSNFKEICSVINKHLNKLELERFRETQFGHLLDVPDHYQHSGQLMWFFVLRQIKTYKNKEMWMLVNGTPMRFSIEEFAVITGLNFAPGPDKESLDRVRKNSRLKDKYFGSYKCVSVHDLKEKLAAMGPRKDDDKLKIALLLFLVGVLRGQKYDSSIDIGLMGIVDDIDFFDSCDWGVKAYEYTLNSLRKNIRFKANESKRKGHAPGSKETYTFSGFVHAFQTWAYEMVPAVANKFAKRREGNVLPRMLRWETNTWNDKNCPTYKEIQDIFRGEQIIRGLLVPTEEEKSLMYITYAIELNDYPDPVTDQLTRNLRSETMIRHAEPIPSALSTYPTERDDETPSTAHSTVPSPPCSMTMGDGAPPPQAPPEPAELPPPRMTKNNGTPPPQEPPVPTEPTKNGKCPSLDFDERLAQMESRFMLQIAAQMAQNAAQFATEMTNISAHMESRLIGQIAQMESRLMVQIAHSNVGYHTPDDRAAVNQDHNVGDANIGPVDRGAPTDDQMSDEVDPREYYTTPQTIIHSKNHYLEEGDFLEDVMSEVNDQPFRMRKRSVNNMESVTPVIDLTNEENEAENSNRFDDIETPGLELEARICRLERSIRRLRRARCSHL